MFIKNENWITFESCLFVNNHCTDEGGAIYLNSNNSHLTLKYNIFMGNGADDEGQSIFNCGYYDSIYNNFWGGKNPSSNNDQLIEWKATFFQKNVHHSDSDPLKMDFTLNVVDCPINDIFNGVVHFYKSNGQLPSGELTGTNFINFTASPNIEIIDKFYGKTRADATFAPDKSGNYTVTASLFGNSISRKINVFDFKIIASEITTFTNVPQTFKVHLEGDKSHTANQKVRVSFFKAYDLITDENGDTNITFNELNLDSGSYLVKVSSCGFTVNSSVNIITTIFAEDVVQVRGDHVTFKAQFTNVKGEFLKKTTQVQFALDGNPYYSLIKDENGNALVDFFSLTRGEHKVLVTNPENGEYKTHRIVILAGFGSENDYTTNQSEDSHSVALSNENRLNNNILVVNPVDTLTNYLVNDVGIFNNVELDNVESYDDLDNKSKDNQISKSITQSKTILNNNNLYLVLLLVLIVALGAFSIRKMKK